MRRLRSSSGYSLVIARTSTPGAEGGDESLGDVVRRRDIAAEDDGLVALGQPFPDDIGRDESLDVIVAFGDRLGAGYESAELGRLALLEMGFFHERAEGQVVAGFFLGLEDGMLVVSVLRFGGAFEPMIEHLDSAIGTRHDAAQEGQGHPVAEPLLARIHPRALRELPREKKGLVE